MSDTSITLNSGSGGANLATYQDSGSVNHERVVLEMQSGSSDPVHVNASNPLPVSGSGTFTISGTVTANAGTGSFTVAQATAANLLCTASQGGSWTVTANAGSGTFTVSGTVTANIGTTNGLALDATVSGLQVAQGSTTSGQKGDLVQGAVTTAAPSYTTAQTSPLSLTTAGALRVDASATTQPVSGTITANAGSGSFTVAQGTAANLLCTASQGGTWTVQPGNTANTTPWLVTDTPSTTGGLSFNSFVSTATNNKTQLKGSAGQLYLVSVQNLAATPVYLKVFNNISANITAGTTACDFQFMIPGNSAGAGLVLNIDKGITMNTGITVMLTAAIAANDNTAVSANQQVVTLGYK